METNTSAYPLRLTGELSQRLSRGLWLVKWLLAIPHFIVLFFLWIAFVGVSVVAVLAILFTGRLRATTTSGLRSRALVRWELQSRRLTQASSARPGVPQLWPCDLSATSGG